MNNDPPGGFGNSLATLVVISLRFRFSGDEVSTTILSYRSCFFRVASLIGDALRRLRVGVAASGSVDSGGAAAGGADDFTGNACLALAKGALLEFVRYPVILATGTTTPPPRGYIVWYNFR